MRNRTFIFKNQPRIYATATLGGPKEGSGPVGKYIDTIVHDDYFGEKTFEKSERKMLEYAIRQAIQKANFSNKEIGAIVAGDLLNQIISSSYACRAFDIPFLGIYNACSTMSEAFIIGGMMVDGGYAENVICATGSHFSSAERQYRYPLELGNTRPPQAQWTGTGAGAAVLSVRGKGPKLVAATLGEVVDFGITDTNNMGAAMAPAAADTLLEHFKNSHFKPEDYDLIITGDLGAFGSRIFKDLMWEKGFDISERHVDCGEMIYNIAEDEFQGGSGAGCSAIVFNGYFYKKLCNKEYKRIVLIATGALLSSVSSQQGESIPSIAHAAVFES